jgi:hypothetical protein
MRRASPWIRANDYLVELARAAGADLLVSGDKHLTQLADPLGPS